MITINNIGEMNNTLHICCLSTDSLNIDCISANGTRYKVTNGSTAYCIDTSQMFVFDEEHKSWVLQRDCILK